MVQHGSMSEHRSKGGSKEERFSESIRVQWNLEDTGEGGRREREADHEGIAQVHVLIKPGEAKGGEGPAREGDAGRAQDEKVALHATLCAAT